MAFVVFFVVVVLYCLLRFYDINVLLMGGTTCGFFSVCVFAGVCCGRLLLLLSAHREEYTARAYNKGGNIIINILELHHTLMMILGFFGPDHRGCCVCSFPEDNIMMTTFIQEASL
jgi:hypothetical protein